MNIIKKIAYVTLTILSIHCTKASTDNIPGFIPESPQMCSQTVEYSSQECFDASAHRTSLLESPVSSNLIFSITRKSTPPPMELHQLKRQKDIIFQIDRKISPCQAQLRPSLKQQDLFTNSRNHYLANGIIMKIAARKSHIRQAQLKQLQTGTSCKMAHTRKKTDDSVEQLTSEDPLPTSRGVKHNYDTNLNTTTYDRQQEKVKDMFGIQELSARHEQEHHNNVKVIPTKQSGRTDIHNSPFACCSIQ